MLYKENISVLIMVLAGLALVFSLMIAKHRQIVRRLDQVRTLAGRIGLYPVQHLDQIYQELCRRQFIMMSLDRYFDDVDRIFMNPLEGIIKGFKVVLFDYRPIVKAEKLEWQSTVAVVGDDNVFAKFVLFPQKLGSAFSPLRMIKTGLKKVHDIIEGYCRIEDLIDGYTLLCPEKSAEQVRSYFNADVLAYFCEHQKYVVEGSGNHLLVYWKKKLIPADQVKSFINEAINIRQRFEKAATDSVFRSESYPKSGAAPESQAVPL